MDRRGKITKDFGGITISSDFDSGNLDSALLDKNGPQDEKVYFTLSTAPDCAGTPFENGNRTWFYFKVVVQANSQGKTLHFIITNMNKQIRLYQQGLTPIVRSYPGKGHWERLRTSVASEVRGETLSIHAYIHHYS